jgi:hypothetical protein
VRIISPSNAFVLLASNLVELTLQSSSLAIVSLGEAGKELAAPVFAFEEFIWDRLGEFLQFTGKPPDDAPLEWRFAYLIREMAVRHGEAGGFPIEPIRALLQRPWWQRVWVLQEIALAKQVVICCGNKALPLSQFAHGMILMRVYHDHVRRKNDDPDPNVKVSEQESPILKANIDNRPSKMLHIRNKFDKMRIKGSLHSLLIQSCILNTKADSTLKATDPRDMIYGLLGLVTDENKGLIAPDYSKPCAEVYRLAAQVLIQSGGIAILSFCQFPKTQPGLPSWVPDWSVPLKLPLEHVTKFETYDKRFSAAKDTEASCTFRDESETNLHILSVSGVLVDTVSELGETLTETEDLTEKLKSALQWLKALEQFSDSNTTIVTQKLQSQEEAIWRTPIQDQGTNENGNICRAPPSFEKGYKAFVTLNTEPESINLMRHYWEKLEAQSRGKRLFTTSQGYLGLGPSHMHVGDELVIIHGVIVPFLLRKGDAHRTLVGEAFVHGIMDGEFMDVQAEVQHFELV